MTKLEPASEEARAEGCTCRQPRSHPWDSYEPDVKIDRDCPLHGQDPDDRRDQWLDDMRERRHERDDTSDDGQFGMWA